MAKIQPNELDPVFLSVAGLNSFDGHNSSPRKQMFCSQIGQTLVINGCTEKTIVTGMEREFGKYTYSTKIPVDAEVIRIIERYRRTLGGDEINENPETLVIYEDVKTKEVGIVSLTTFTSYHQYFGFRNKPTKNLNNLRVGAAIPKDTIFMDSPAVSDNGDYMPGRQSNVAFMTIPGVSEDGIAISRDALEDYSFYTYERRTVEFGKEYFPLNTCGNVDVFKAFPDIGEFVRPDGILMALRKYEKDLAPVEMSIYDLMEIDAFFDKPVYAGAGGRIVDIKVYHDDRNYGNATPLGMESQANKYYQATRQYYSEIVAEYQKLRRMRGDNLKVTPQFHRLLVEALSFVEETDNYIMKVNGKNPLDDWRIEFVIEYKITPNIGFKASDIHGKAVN